MPKHRGGEQIPVSELHFIEASVIIDVIFGGLLVKGLQYLERHCKLAWLTFILLVFLSFNFVDVMMKISVNNLSCKHRREDLTFSEPWTVADIFQQSING